MDSLTGLAGLKQAHRELELLVACGAEFGVVLIDIDWLKPINDEYGHAVGDRVLQAVALLIRHQAESDSMVFRIGGDEFLIFCLSGTAAALAEKIRSVAEQHPEKPFPNLSAGIARFPQDAREPELLLRRADAALHRAKNGGRNQVQVFQTGPG